MVVLFKKNLSKVEAVIGSILVSFGSLVLAFSRNTGFLMHWNSITHQMSPISALGLVLGLSSSFQHSAYSTPSFFISDFSKSALRTGDLLKPIEPEVETIVCLSELVVRELPIVRSEKSESTLKLS